MLLLYDIAHHSGPLQHQTRSPGVVGVRLGIQADGMPQRLAAQEPLGRHAVQPEPGGLQGRGRGGPYKTTVLSISMCIYIYRERERERD